MPLIHSLSPHSHRNTMGSGFSKDHPNPEKLFIIKEQMSSSKFNSGELGYQPPFNIKDVIDKQLLKN